MKIKKLKLINFRNYENFEIDFNENMNVIVAENGAGKTTILDAIAIGYGAMFTRFPKIKGKTFGDSDLRFDNDNRLSPYMRVELESYNKISWDRTQARNKTKMTKNLIPKAKGLRELNDYVDCIVDKEYAKIYQEYEIPLVMYYGTSRAVIKSPMRKRDFQKEFSRYEALSGALEANSDFKRLFQWFDAMQNRENKKIVELKDFDYKLPELEAVREAITKVIPNIENPRVEERPLRFVVDKIVEGKAVEFRIDQLSDGYKTVLAMVMDISARMSEANPHLGNQSKALIMIDEVDLHLHPRWQQSILIDLQKAFPKAQFIVTTHSPQVLSHVKAEHIFLLKQNKDNVDIIKPTSSYGKSSDRQLEDILGVDARPSEIKEDLHRLFKLIQDMKLKEAKELMSELENKIEGREVELVKANVLIKRKEILGK